MKDAGFTPGNIEVTAAGSVVRKGDLLLLEMPGPVRQFVLADGPKAEELKRQPDLPGKRLLVIGKLHPSHADRPPGITVERFELSGK